MHISFKTTAGPSVTVSAWGYANAASATSNYLGLLQALRGLQADPAGMQETQALADAVIRDAGLQPEALLAADLPGLLEVIHELNAVEELLGKPVALLVRCLTALQRAQEPESAESATPVPGTAPG